MRTNGRIHYNQLSIVVPEHRTLDVFELLLECQSMLQADGEAVKVMMKQDVPELPHVAVPVVEGGTVERSAADTRIDTRRPGKNGVVYRVVNPSIKVGQVPHEVRMFILTHGPTTARKIQEGTGRGMKSVESALWGLRHAGSVESVEDTGVPVKQKRFGKKVIAAGAPESAPAAH